MTSSCVVQEAFENEISYLKETAYALLEQIGGREARLRRLQLQKIKIDPVDLQALEEGIQRFLRMLALIDTYRFFQERSEALTDQNRDRFNHIANCFLSMKVRHFFEELHSRVSGEMLNANS